LFTIVLHPGNAPCSRGAIGILMRIIARLRRAFPKTRLRVRLDGGFASPAILDYLEQERAEYQVGFTGNPALEAQVEPLMRAVRILSSSSGKTETLFTDIRYQTKTWLKPRRLIVKAEVVRFPDRPARDNDQYVVTNLTLKPERVYAIYRGRGDMENRIKELHHGLEVDRTSCTSFKANQFRVLLTAAAYVRTPASCSRHRICCGAGEHPAPTPLQARRVGTSIGSPYRHSSSAQLSVGPKLARHCISRGRNLLTTFTIRPPGTSVTGGQKCVPLVRKCDASIDSSFDQRHPAAQTHRGPSSTVTPQSITGF